MFFGMLSDKKSKEVYIEESTFMTKKELEKKIAYLEFINDQISTELKYVDKLLKLIGFPEGLETLKSASQELIQEIQEEEEST